MQYWSMQCASERQRRAFFTSLQPVRPTLFFFGRRITNVLNSNSDVDDRWLEVEMGDLQASNNLTLSLNSV